MLLDLRAKREFSGSVVHGYISEMPSKYRPYLYFVPSIAWFAGVFFTGNLLFGEAVLSAEDQSRIDLYLDDMFFLFGPYEMLFLLALFIYAVAFIVALTLVLYLAKAAFQHRAANRWPARAFGFLGLSQMLLSVADASSIGEMIGRMPDYSLGLHYTVSLSGLLVVQAALAASVCLSLYLCRKQINLSSRTVSRITP
jgi:hypothetical protein